MLQKLWDKVSGYKTLIFGVLVASAGAALEILQFMQTVDLSMIVNARFAAIANILIGLTIIVLRFYTTTPITVAEPAPPPEPPVDPEPPTDGAGGV